jgi:superfamily II DNA or RNA helicase
MGSPDPDVIRASFGYHPVTTDLEDILAAGAFEQLLVFGPGTGDVVHLVSDVRIVAAPPVQLPQGVYWFSGVEPTAALAVLQGAPAGPSTVLDPHVVEEGSALANALAWVEDSWETASAVPPPLFTVGQEILVDATGHDGIVRSPRRFVSGGWLYTVFSEGQTLRRPQGSLSARPLVDNASAWVASAPVSPRRFAATLSRAKLAGQFTDTVFSFRATRTLFRPYQFKPVQKLLNTGTLRLLIADEVGLGKTIEAGLVWTELEARRQADRVLVVCPSSLVSKWQREMEERFGFDLVELTTEALSDLLDRLESDRVRRRIAYVTSIERLRMWDGLDRATELGMHFDLAIVDEAHSFRNSDTRSYELGEHIQNWADALVMLSATPVNLRNRDLFNLLSLLVPGEFEDIDSLEARLSPNRVLNRITKSLLDPDVTNSKRLSWLGELENDPFGRLLTLRPDFALLRTALAKPTLNAADAVQVKRVCAELHGLSAQVTRTRKVEIQEEKPLREAHKVPVRFNTSESSFYEAYFDWCVERAAVTGSPLNFAMQMPLRLAGSCLPEAAAAVLEWTGRDDLEIEDGAPPVLKSSDIAPGPQLIEGARSLKSDTKFEQFDTALGDLVRQDKRCIVFTFSRRTLRYLEARLAQRYRVCVLHGSVPKRRRDEVMRSFRAGTFDVLLASKVASEGLDFEFCSAVINYDLPWNPMEVEQRIGRIDRIGQREKKIGVLNFHTPGTIETDIIERVMDRIGVFEHAIGELEPILDSRWRDVEGVLFDFSLSAEQREQRSREMILAIEAQAQALDEIESAAPLLVSSDGADIDGLERDLLSSGRYVGQDELGLLVRDWAETFGGQVEQDDQILRLRGNEELADHVQRLIRTGERSSSEVADLAGLLRSDQAVTLSLDQEHSRLSGIDLLTATHPLTRAAVGTPGYRQGRFSLLMMDSLAAGVPPGTYLTLLAVVSWNGLRPLHEVWASTIEIPSMADAGDALGSAVMKELARGGLRAAPLRDHGGLVEAVDLATVNLEVRAELRRHELTRENDAFIETRRLSFQQVHERRARRVNDVLRTHRQRGNLKVIAPTEARIRKEEARFAAQLVTLESASNPGLTTDDLAVCVVEVRP